MVPVRGGILVTDRIYVYIFEQSYPADIFWCVFSEFCLGMIVETNF